MKIIGNKLLISLVLSFNIRQGRWPLYDILMKKARDLMILLLKLRNGNKRN